MKIFTFFLESVFWLAWGSVFYSYFLFPLLLAAFARFRGQALLTGRGPEAGEDERDWPTVTMVVAAYNEASVLPAKLANTWKIDYPQGRFEILIGSDGSSDGSGDVLRSCTDPRLQACVFEARRGKISVLNDLVARSEADILVMSDANTMFAPEAVKALVRQFDDPRVGCVSGELRLDEEGGVSGEGLYWKYESWIKRCESRLGFLIGCNGGIFALRRRLYSPLPVSTIVEDFVLTLRVLEQGYRVLFEPAARATEPPCPSARAEMVRKTRIGAGGWQALGLTGGLLHPRHGLCAFAFFGHKVLRWAAPLLLLAAMLANLGLLHSHFYDLLLVLQIVGAAVSVATYRAGTGRLGGGSRLSAALSKGLRPLSYFYLMNYSLLCGFVRFLFKTQRVTWDKSGAAGSQTASSQNTFRVSTP